MLGLLYIYIMIRVCMLGGHWLGKVRWGKVRLTFVR